MFTHETLEFLAENCWQSSRDWFHAHRNEYLKFVREPLCLLSEKLAPVALEIDDHLVTATASTVSRINRDIRFTRGGSLYRDTLWVTFRRDRKAFEAWPELFFIISPRECFYGCGYYCIKAPVMAEIRKMVLSDHPKYLAAQAAIDSQSFFAIEGETYKRSKFKDESDKKRAWLDRKNICVTHYADGNELFSEELLENIARTFTNLKPIYDFFAFAEELADIK